MAPAGVPVTGTRLALVIAGVLLFGLLTFAMGLVVGVQLSVPPATVPVGGTPTAPPAPAQPATAPPASQGSVRGGGGQVDVAPAPTPQAPSQPAAPAVAPMPAPMPTPKPAGSSPGPASAAAPVQDLRSGPPPGPVPPSPLQGPLVRQAAARPPPPPPPANPVPPLPVSDRIISVQVGRFLLPEGAAELAGRVAAQGHKAVIVATTEPGTPTWHVVTLGPQPDETTAQRLADETERTLGLRAVVVTWAKPGP